MSRLLIAAAIFLALASSAFGDQPWVAYGQTTIAVGTSVDNPATNKAGAIGEVSLPYTVPAGYILELTSWGVEAYPSVGPSAIFPWIGPGPVTNAKALHTVMANDHYEESTGLRYQFPAGTIINVRVVNGETANFVYGWQMTGRLIPVDPLPAPEPAPTPTPCTCP